MKTNRRLVVTVPLLALWFALLGLTDCALAGQNERVLQPPPWTRTEIAEGWRIRQLAPCNSLNDEILAEAEEGRPSEEWLSVSSMPKMVHDVLLDHRKIETPWLPGKAAECQWVADRDWIYAVRFRARDLLGQSFLRFAGLDTIVDIYLNGEKIASNCNMYTSLRVDVGSYLDSDNTLV